MCRPTRLKKAWVKVHENGINSKCEQTKKEIRIFAAEAERYIDQIYRKLLKKKWQFEPALGVTKRRQGKKPRPLVVSPIPNRIVQRTILDVLQAEPTIKAYYEMESSFGGIEGRGVRDAIEKMYTAINNGARYYIRTDIKEFFRYIPRDRVLSKIAEKIPDSDFNELLKAATNIELKNLHALKDFADLFPLYEIGVAQGCCLSPLIGNILLYEFDSQMNGRGIICLRYIDDFIMLGSDLSHLGAAFKNAKQLLKEYGLEVYDPDKDKGKAEMGDVIQGVEFLGCTVIPGLITPSKESRKRVLDRIKSILSDSMTRMKTPDKLYLENMSLAQTLVAVDNVLVGWGNQYSFCNNIQIMDHLDAEIDKLLNAYFDRYSKIKSSFQDKELKRNRRKLLGVHLLVDSKSNPIIKKRQ